jgi:excisionase family DNA binding protein
VVGAETIDLQTAAQRLGVHYQTAYRWVRSGELRAKLVMGCYQLDSDVVDRFADRRARAVSPPPRRPRTGYAVLSERMFGHLVAGDERGAARLVGGLLDAGVSVTTVAQAVLVPALREIGAEWRAGRLDVTDEHRASAIVERILGERYPKPRGRRRGTAVVAALSGDRHALPTTLAAVALSEDNWLVHHIGADLPAAELMRFCKQESVDLVVLTVTVTDVRPEASRTATLLEELGVRVLVGGPGRSLDELQRLARRERRQRRTAAAAPAAEAQSVG